MYAKVENGVEKITHAARHTPSGEWTSKLGDYEDIAHPRLEDLEGPEYGKAVCYLARSGVN